ncbi:MAG: hypothetical protein ACI83Q_000436 [Colwellia polaris]|jgi:hypothetical protein
MIHETLPLPQEITTLALLVGLVAVFYIAYKLMEMVFQTITISIMSGGFYAAFSYLFLGGLPSLMDILFFALLGSVLYIVFTLLESAYTVSKHLVKIPVAVIEIVLYPAKKLYNALKKELEKSKQKNSEDQQESSSGNKSDNENKGTKEVVIDKVNQEDEDD